MKKEKGSVTCFKPIYEKGISKVIILGNVPGERSRNVEFYYMDSRNKFWEIIDFVTGENNFFENKKKEYIETYKELKEGNLNKKEIEEKQEKIKKIKKIIEAKIKEHKIAIFDVIQNCVRTGSLDNNIEKNTININDLKDMCGSVDHIFINGITDKSTSPYGIFKRNYEEFVKDEKVTPLLSSSSSCTKNDKKTQWKNAIEKYIK